MQSQYRTYIMYLVSLGGAIVLAIVTFIAVLAPANAHNANLHITNDPNILISGMNATKDQLLVYATVSNPYAGPLIVDNTLRFQTMDDGQWVTKGPPGHAEFNQHESTIIQPGASARVTLTTRLFPGNSGNYRYGLLYKNSPSSLPATILFDGGVRPFAYSVRNTDAIRVSEYSVSPRYHHMVYQLKNVTKEPLPVHGTPTLQRREGTTWLDIDPPLSPEEMNGGTLDTVVLQPGEVAERETNFLRSLPAGEYQLVHWYTEDGFTKPLAIEFTIS